MKRIALILIIFSLSFSAFAQKKNTEITQKELKEYVSYLASNELKGRQPGTPEGFMAATYIADYYKKLGLKSFGNSYFQYLAYSRFI